MNQTQINPQDELEKILLDLHEAGEPDPSAQDFAQYLRAQRQSLELTLAKLAAQTKLSITTLTALENGAIPSSNIDQTMLDRLAQALNKDVNDLALILDRPIEQPSIWQTAAQTVKKAVLSLIPTRITTIMIFLIIALGVAYFNSPLVRYDLRNPKEPKIHMFIPFLNQKLFVEMEEEHNETEFELKIYSDYPVITKVFGDHHFTTVFWQSATRLAIASWLVSALFFLTYGSRF